MSFVSAVEVTTSVGFRGDSFVELKTKFLPHTSRQQNDTLVLFVSTQEEDGLLFRQGQEEEGREGGDFMALSGM